VSDADASVAGGRIRLFGVRTSSVDGGRRHRGRHTHSHRHTLSRGASLCHVGLGLGLGVHLGKCSLAAGQRGVGVASCVGDIGAQHTERGGLAHHAGVDGRERADDVGVEDLRDVRDCVQQCRIAEVGSSDLLPLVSGPRQVPRAQRPLPPQIRIHSS
jgi:hypothetical protein